MPSAPGVGAEYAPGVGAVAKPGVGASKPRWAGVREDVSHTAGVREPELAEKPEEEWYGVEVFGFQVDVCLFVRLVFV